MEKKDITGLLDKVKAGTATPAEETAVKRWLHELNQQGASGLSDEDLKQGRVAMWQAIKAAQGTKTRPMWYRIAAAASIVVFLSAGGYFLLRKEKAPQQVAALQKVDVLPGNQSAVLQLSNGQQIALNSAKTGAIATQGNTNIIKTADNKVMYEAGAPSTELVYNTVTTKRGNFYPLTLSDGTVAILDAGSSIKYPVNFIGNERRVEITGQVYFEVKHNAKMPFRVSVKGQTIEDIGTAFNVNAYEDEPNIKTTLIEGSVKINQATLTPGQQAIITNNQIKVKAVNTDQAIAWKNGLFNFEGMKLEEAMRQISRWYDVEVEYPDGTPKTVFHGEMHRNVNASQVLEVLKFFKVNFQIVQGSDGKKILVKP
ncbi:FecR family protein [Mucilaginibacter ximonensis]|uniref:FecR family protein n=1 Tax=Mucilaginibacter ximonensis TaxID=538021 RepID=A0ABW5Y9T3_9SPHI